MFWILLSLILILAAWILLDWYSRNEGFEKIPGPKGIYLIGNGFDVLMDTVKLFYYFRYLANEYKDMYAGKLGTKRFVGILNPEDVETVISGSKNTKKGYLYKLLKPWLNEGLLLSNGSKWHDRRRILTPAFHFNVLLNYMTVFEEHSRKLIEQLSFETDKPKTDIYTFLSDSTLSAICETAMGVKLDAQNESSKRYKDGIYKVGELTAHRGQRFWLHPDTLFAMSSTGRKLKEVLLKLGSFRDSVVNNRRQDGPHTISNVNSKKEYIVYKKKRMAMLDLLLQAEKDGAIDAQGISEEVDTFMFEGHDTTATCLQFAFMLLANNQEAQDKVFEECKEIFEESDRAVTMEDLNRMKYLECCLKETLRLYPSVYFMFRTIENDIQIREYCLPAGTECGILMYDLHRRADQFPEPLEFRPERFLKAPTWHPYAYIPFSAGPRNCIGQKFAMIEMKVFLAAVIRRYRIWPVTKPPDLHFFVDFVLRTKNPIYVKIEHRA